MLSLIRSVFCSSLADSMFLVKSVLPLSTDLKEPTGFKI